ncbi:MAG TPA: hypothetical protein VFY10_07045 [Dehalococcoidia bacterium]|nr:hypothetical protein [Dehalococcoidia bacterium]
MAIAVLYEFPDMTQDQYDRLMSEAFQDRIAPELSLTPPVPWKVVGGRLTYTSRRK